MYKTFLCILISIWALELSAQEAKQQTQKIPSTYDRSSITFLLLDFPSDNHSSEIKGKVDQIAFADKFYNNNVNYLTLESPFIRGDLRGKKEEQIRQSIDAKKITTDIIAKWYSRKDDGTMSTDLIEERGMFNATDAAVIKAQTTKRGNSMLKDYGNRLIERSYILVLDYKDVKTMAEAKVPKMKGWKASVTGYLFKIDYNDEIQNALYETWIYDDDTPQVKADKKAKFDRLQFPITFVTQTQVMITSSQAESTTTVGKLIKKKTEEELLVELLQKGYDESLYFLEKNYEDFRVKTPIYQVNPIRAKVGKKEGIKTDYRFFAYEYVYNEKTNTTKQKFRGVIRATSKIVDNRQVATGDMGTTKFYQTAGRHLETGYLLQQRNDFGIEVGLGYESGEIGGVYGRVDARLGRFISIKSLFLYVEGGAEMKTYDVNFTEFKDISFARYGFGIAKGLMLTRNIELRLYGGLGQEMATHKDFKNQSIGGVSLDGIKVLYGRGGANLALNLKHNFQIFGGMGVYSFIGYPTNTDDKEIKVNWDVLFKDRVGPSALAGIKIDF